MINLTLIHPDTGDPQCPFCKTVHMTPEGMELQSGPLVCQFCGRLSFLEPEDARRGNEITTRLILKQRGQANGNATASDQHEAGK